MNLNLGDIKRGFELGYTSNKKYTWIACDICGKPRWVGVVGDKPLCLLCYHCAVRTDEHREKMRRANTGRHPSDETRSKMSQRRGENSPRWKGGRIGAGKGYIKVQLLPDDPYYEMATINGYVLEHRLVMARHLGRLLKLGELVHHKNGVRGDNRPVNLAVVGTGNHSHRTLKGLLQKRIRDLEGELAKRQLL